MIILFCLFFVEKNPEKNMLNPLIIIKIYYICITKIFIL